MGGRGKDWGTAPDQENPRVELKHNDRTSPTDETPTRSKDVQEKDELTNQVEPSLLDLQRHPVPQKTKNKKKRVEVLKHRWPSKKSDLQFPL